jgi:hypothetical protein
MGKFTISITIFKSKLSAITRGYSPIFPWCDHALWFSHDPIWIPAATFFSSHKKGSTTGFQKNFVDFRGLFHGQFWTKLQHFSVVPNSHWLIDIEWALVLPRNNRSMMVDGIPNRSQSPNPRWRRWIARARLPAIKATSISPYETGPP